MKAIQITEERKMSLVEIDNVNELKPGEVLLKMEYVGFCGSDLSTFLGKNPMVKMPVIPGHEGAVDILGLGDFTFLSYSSVAQEL